MIFLRNLLLSIYVIKIVSMLLIYDFLVTQTTSHGLYGLNQKLYGLILNKQIFTISSLEKELLNDICISMAWEMKITWYSFYFKPSFHSASFTLFEVWLCISSFLLSILRINIHIILRQYIFGYCASNIYFMNFQYILYIETEHRAWKFGEAYINIHFEFLIKVLMIDD